MNTRNNIYCATFIATGVGLGFSFAHVPNIELITATIFIAGYFLGFRNGIIVGIITEALYSGLNPYGMAAPPLFVAQITAMGITGAMGALVRKYFSEDKTLNYLLLGFLGFILTINFAILTTLAFVLFINFSWDKLLGSFIFGITFYLTHFFTNTLIFLFVVPTIIELLKKVEIFQQVKIEKAIR